MTDVVSRPRASFGSSVLVALGWYATVLAAVFVALDGIPEAPRTDCATFAGCMTPMQATGLALAVVGLPVLIVVVAVTLAVTAGTVRLTGSSIVAGTLAAAGSAVVAAGIGAAFLAAR
jgi:hypothetical protein